MANLKEQLEKAKQGIYIDNDGSNHCHNFYDWFCSEKALKNKAKRLFGQLRTFLKYHPEIDIEKVYCFFKNNCPVYGTLYDDFRICDIETGDVIYTVIPKTGHALDEGRAQLWGRENDFKEQLKSAPSYKYLFK